MTNKLRLGCSPLSNTIFGGHLIEKGKIWGINIQDVTMDALMSVAEHVTNFGKPVEITKEDGTLEYTITVKKHIP